MAEMTPERRAAWQAEEDREAEQRKAIDRERKNKSNAKKRKPPVNEFQNEPVLRMRWFEAFTGPANGNRMKASEIAGYAESQWRIAGDRNFKHFAPRLARMAEEKINRSTLIEMTARQARGIGRHRVFDEDGIEIWAETLKNVFAAGDQDLLEGVKQGKYGQEISTPSTQSALKMLVDISGIAAPIKVNLSNTPRAELESEGDIYLRELAGMSLIDGDSIEADYDDFDTQADDSAD